MKFTAKSRGVRDLGNVSNNGHAGESLARIPLNFTAHERFMRRRASRARWMAALMFVGRHLNPIIRLFV